MIAQYIIDWQCVRDRIDRVACVDDVALERLRGRLSALREKISENGVLIVDEDTCLLNLKKAVAPRLTQACRPASVSQSHFRRRIKPAGA